MRHAILTLHPYSLFCGWICECSYRAALNTWALPSYVRGLQNLGQQSMRMVHIWMRENRVLGHCIASFQWYYWENDICIRLVEPPIVLQLIELGQSVRSVFLSIVEQGQNGRHICQLFLLFHCPHLPPGRLSPSLQYYCGIMNSHYNIAW